MIKRKPGITKPNANGQTDPFSNRGKTFPKFSPVTFLLVVVIILLCALLFKQDFGTVALYELIQSSNMAPEPKSLLRSKDATTKLIVKETKEEEIEWPSVAVEGIGHPLTKKGTTFVEDMHTVLFKQKNKDGVTMMEEFLEVYKNRPDKVNKCGVRINHALAIFYTVRVLDPTTIIESGVNAGQSTYFFRKAKPTVEVLALDPAENPICKQKRWTDTSGYTKYYLGKDFIDIGDFDWLGMAKKGTINPERTLAFIDDHMDVMDRYPPLFKAGIKHVMIEDNYKLHKGATSQDQAGHTPKQMFQSGSADGNWLFNNVVSYAEFPPLVPATMSKYSGKKIAEGGIMYPDNKNDDIVAPLLRSDVNEEDLKIYKDVVKKLDLDPTLEEEVSFWQMMHYNQICYLELLPMARHYVDKW
jgi:hypothetical protein